MNLTTHNLPVGTPMTTKLPGFDPVALMMQRKYQSEEDVPVVEYDPRDIKELEDFCNKHGIVGFDCKRMPPKSALQMLKRKVGYSHDVIKDLKGATKEKTLLQG